MKIIIQVSVLAILMQALCLSVTLSFKLTGILSGFRGLFYDQPDASNNLIELITSKGYIAESYTVQTEDGYLLSLTRIPYGRGQSPSSSRPVALLFHPLLTASDVWTINFPDESLGFILADAGYDVFLACDRGCKYSRQNVNFATDTNAFWDFSWQDIGEKDAPAFVDFTLNKTGQEKLFLIGHSMGTTVSLVFLSLKPEYNSKMRAVMMMAPVANATYTTSPVRLLVPIRNDLYKLFLLLTHGEVKTGPVLDILVNLVCGNILTRDPVCSGLLFLADGVESPRQFNTDRLPVYTAHFPGGGSAKQLLHYGQLINSKQFAKFDYGREGNFKRYGQASPPAFPLERITAPVGLFWSQEDQLADPKDVANLRTQLTNVVEFYKISFRPWTHMDFVIGVEAKKYVYDKMLKVMAGY